MLNLYYLLIEVYIISIHTLISIPTHYTRTSTYITSLLSLARWKKLYYWLQLFLQSRQISCAFDISNIYFKAIASVKMHTFLMVSFTKLCRGFHGYFVVVTHNSKFGSHGTLSIDGLFSSLK